MMAVEAPERPAPRRARAWSEPVWERIFRLQGGGQEVEKWVAFGRRLVLAFAGLLLVVSLAQAFIWGLQTRDVLLGSLDERSRALAEAAARAAYVPLSLEDRGTLAVIARELLPVADVVEVRIAETGGKVWADVGRAPVPGERLTAAEAEVRAPLRAGGAREPVGVVRIVMSGARARREFWAVVATSLLANGVLIAVLLSAALWLIRGLTLRMQSLVDEARLVAELKRSNKELEEFAYVASHDLQSPLRKVAGFAELLREAHAAQLDAEGLEFLGFMVEGTRRMQGLIEDLLTYSRVGSRQLKPEAVDLADVVRQVVGDLEPRLRDTGGAVDVGELPSLVADRRQMGQLFQNLIGNALKFRGAEPPRVEVRAAREGAFWRFSVRDNGIGIDPRYADQLFKMFRRLHTAGAYEGSGIGLAITRKIVERHGGSIWFESRPGDGTTFHFTLQAATRTEPSWGGSHG